MSSLSLRDVNAEISSSFRLRDIALSCQPGETLGIIGANGSGKSSLMKLIAGISPTSSGEILLGDSSVHEMPGDERAKHIGYLPQHARFGWSINVFDAVALGRHHLRSTMRSLSEADKQAIESAMRDSDVWQLRGRSVTELSGGESMRVHLARVFAGNHMFILADEPNASLDLNHQFAMMEILRCQAEKGSGVLVVLHDLSLAQRYCDRLILLDYGRIILDGPPNEILTSDALQTALDIKLESVIVSGREMFLPHPNQ